MRCERGPGVSSNHVGPKQEESALQLCDIASAVPKCFCRYVKFFVEEDNWGFGGC